MNSNSRGQIITFYSYKGGTGRSMALANIACILAERQSAEAGKGVLMIDWDLEAPGLHRFFRNRLTTIKLGIERIERGDSLDSKPGLIDLFYELDKRTDYHNYKGKEEQRGNADGQPLSGEQLARATINDVNLQQYVLGTTVKGLSLLKAGCFRSQDPNEYSERVNKFNWEALYKKSPHLIRLLAETLAQNYAYVLIDSRTGVTDISGICTMLLPEKLVVVFTPNLQSLKGGLDLIRRATDYRKESADLRPLLVFPLVSRVEANEPDLRHNWRFGNSDIAGYQPEFEKLLAEVYEKHEIKFDKYFDELQIQHIPRYAYGEEIAVLIEKIGDKFSLRRSYQTFANKLIEARAPWEGEISAQGSLQDGGASSLSTAVSSLLDTLSLSGTRRSVRMAVVLFLLAMAFSMSVVAYSQFQRAETTRGSLEDARKDTAASQQQLALLNQRLKELQEPLKALEQKDATIKDLYAKLDQANKDLDAAKQDALKSSNQLTDALIASKRAGADAARANSQAADALKAKNQAEAEAANAKRQADSAQKDAYQAKQQVQTCNQRYQEALITIKKLQDQNRSRSIQAIKPSTRP
jgi:cellulose biosynthesis protein BcsQ